MAPEYYQGWSGGYVKETPPIVGSTVTSLAMANARCASEFGNGYRMAEFHDGKYVPGMTQDNYYGNTWPNSGLQAGGWSFYAYGTLGASQFWTSINDQFANCWNTTTGNAMTWTTIGAPATQSNSVGCSRCDPYNGDTSCATHLPVLCLKPEGLARENYDVETGSEYTEGWAGGHIRFTDAIPGTRLLSLRHANSICAATFGAGYRMAEFHDGKYVMGMGIDSYFGSTWPVGPGLSSGGWHFSAYGSVPTGKFWTYINDQDANCWGR